MRKTRKYPYMFGSVRRNKENRKNPIYVGPPVHLDCVSCVSEPICLNSKI